MDLLPLLSNLIYLDRGYIADRYEATTGTSPNTTISSVQGGKAGVGIPFFSAEVSAQETRSFPVSTLTMLSKTLGGLEEEPALNAANLKSGMRSSFGWVTGTLSAFRAKTSKSNSDGKSETLEEARHFSLRIGTELRLALITTPEYFYNGLDTLLKVQQTVVKDMAWPVRVFVRVIPAQGHVLDWVAVPLVILEDTSLSAGEPLGLTA